MTRPDALPEEAWLAALGGLPGMGPARLRLLLGRWSPSEAWDRIASGDPALGALRAPSGRGIEPGVHDRWRRAARAVDVAGLWLRHRRAGVGVAAPGDASFPPRLRDDIEPPTVLFRRGRPEVAGAPAVAVVGTRRCSATGRAVARELGRDLAAAGVTVVSGLALGVDGAAHAGALEAGGGGVVGVVATGLDVVYPRRHAELWRAVAECGSLLSEYPLGTSPEPWRFPARNRLIAALADVVVVVESHAGGGSLHTVDAALERDRVVMAVPGSVRSPASDGTNALLAAGAAPVRDAGDVLAVLGVSGHVPSRAAPEPPGGDAGAVLDALGGDPATLEQLAARLDVPVGPLAVHLTGLEAAGWVVRTGAWYQRAAPS